MIVEINDPSRAKDLIAYLRAAQCIAERDGDGKIVVTLPASNEEAARHTLESYLAAWQEAHPGIEARRKPRYDL